MTTIYSTTFIPTGFVCMDKVAGGGGRAGGVVFEFRKPRYK